MKLYLTLEDDDGQKVERVLKLDEDEVFEDNYSNIIWEMRHSLKESKKPL